MLKTLFLKLGTHDALSDAEMNLLASALTAGRRVAPGQEIVVEGSRPSTSTLLVDGFAARYKMMADGGRQITAIHISGDFVDLHAFLLKEMDHGIVALSPCTIAAAGHAALKQITERAPHLARLLWLETLIDGAIHRNWIVAMGRRSKAAHLAHLICELYVRLRAVGRAEDGRFHFPLSQTEMADVLGLSFVHMNRVIQRLRRERLISWDNQVISILDWERLQQIAEFDPTYLSFSVEPR